MTAATLTPLPPKEAIRFFQPKGLKPAFAWQDVWQEEHAAAFTVAKMTQIDLLADVKASLDKALADGDSFAAWQKSVRPMLEARGWWGRTMLTDPLDGELKSVQLGSPRRLRIIYDTNMRMSRAAGAWDRIQERKKARPYLRYVAVLDEQTRDDHRRWHGVILPVDHPFWRSHYPPNGWKCRCTVEQLAARDLEREGWRVTSDEELDKTGWRETKDWINARTGETVKVPVGIDPGFGYNVGVAGREAAALRAALPRLNAAAPEIARPAAQALVDSPAFEHFIAGKAAADDDHQTAWPFPAPQRLIDALQAATVIVQLSADTMAKQRGEKPGNPGHPELTVEEYRLIGQIMAEGHSVPSKKPLHRGFVHQIGDQFYELIVKRTQRGDELFIQSLTRKDAADAQNIIKRGWATALWDDVRF